MWVNGCFLELWGVIGAAPGMRGPRRSCADAGEGVRATCGTAGVSADVVLQVLAGDECQSVPVGEDLGIVSIADTDRVGDAVEVGENRA